MRRLRSWPAAVTTVCVFLLLAGCVDPSAFFRDRSVQRLTAMPWVVSVDEVRELDAVGQSYVALEIDARHHFELVALSRSTGRTMHRLPIDPLRGWAPNAWLDVKVLDGAVAYHRGAKPSQDRLDFLDPTTFKVRWSRHGAVDEVADCRPMVCLSEENGVVHVIDPKTGRERWHSKAVEIAWLNYLVKVAWQDDHYDVSRVDPATGRELWTADTVATLPTPASWRYAQGSWGPVPGGRAGANTSVARHKGQRETLVGASVYAPDGGLLWSRRVRMSTATNLLIDVHSDTAVGILDPATGRTRARLRAPHGYQATSNPLAFDVLGRRWASFETTGGKHTALTFRPLDETSSRLVRATPGMHLPVLSYDYDEADTKVAVRGTSHSVPEHIGLRPLDSGTGELTAMPRVPLPRALRDPWNPLVSVISRNGHALMEPAP